MVIEAMHEKVEEAMAILLQSLFKSFIISFDQMKNVSCIIIKLGGLLLSQIYVFYRGSNVSMK